MLGKIIKNTGVQAVGKMMMVGISLVTTGVLTRRLGAGVYGQFVLIGSLFVFLDTLADFGNRIIGVRELAGRTGEDFKKGWGDFLGARLMTSLAAGAVGAAVVLLVPSFEEFREEAVLALLMIGMTSIAGALETKWQAEMKMERKVVLQVLFPVFFLVILWSFRESVSLMVVIGGYLAARAISLGVAVARESWLFKEVKIDYRRVVRVLRMIWPMGLYLLVFTAYDRVVDSLMIERILGIKEVAFYGLAYKIYATLLQPAAFLSGSMFAAITGRTSNRRIIFWQTTGVMIGGALLVIVGVNLGAEWMVKVLAGDGFEKTAAVLKILMGALLFSYLGHLSGYGLIAKEGQKEILELGVLVLIFNIAMNLLMIPRFGIIGAAWVTVATEALGVGLSSWKLSRKVGLR